MSSDAREALDSQQAMAAVTRSTTGPCTDVRNAERLVDWFGGELRYVPAWSKWLVWDGRRWVIDLGETRVRRLAIETTRRMLGSARTQRDEAERAIDAAAGTDAGADSTKDARRRAGRSVEWALRSQHSTRVSAMIELARSDARVVVAHEQLDADRWLLNVENGTLDLRTGALRPHRPTDLLTKLAPVRFDPEALAPAFERFVARAMGQNPDLVSYLRRLAGYLLTGVIREQALFFFFGGGANGKSTFLCALIRLLGEYATIAPRNFLSSSDAGSHPTGLATLYGTRLAVCGEVQRGSAFDEAKVKDLTGGEAISARRMRENFWTFEPSHKLVIQGNHKPVVRGTDDGIWRRIRLVPWTVSVPTAEQDPELLEKLVAELPGLLNWAIGGCLEWQQSGLGEPIAVRDATKAYRSASDPLASFLQECCFSHADARVTRKALLEAYRRFAQNAGISQPLDARAFAAALRERGVEERKARDEDDRPCDGWAGLRLLAESERGAASAASPVAEGAAPRAP